MKNIYNYFGIPKESVDIAVFFCFMALLGGTTTKSGSEIRRNPTPKENTQDMSTGSSE